MDEEKKFVVYIQLEGAKGEIVADPLTAEEIDYLVDLMEKQEILMVTEGDYTHFIRSDKISRFTVVNWEQLPTLTEEEEQLLTGEIIYDEADGNGPAVNEVL